MKYFSYVSFITAAVFALHATGIPGCSDGIFNAPDDAGSKTYEVTVENLTDTQPFSPGVFATHTRKVDLFEVGEHASEGIRYIAENGDPSMAVSDLTGLDHVYRVMASDAPIGPGGSMTKEIDARANANRLSLAVMLVCTNDGFTGVSTVKLPGGMKAETHEVGAYDAGTEMNDETSETIVDGCFGDDGNERTATDEPIAMHEGIQGTADLTEEMHGWMDPVARITVRRVK